VCGPKVVPSSPLLAEFLAWLFCFQHDGRTPSVRAMHELLAEITEDVAQRSVDAWRPAFGSSSARKEAEAVSGLLRSDGATPWGTAPIEVVWKASELLYVAVLEYSRATARLMVAPFRTWAPITEVRSAVEAAARVSWLFDPGVADGQTRIGRYYTLRLHAAHQLEYTYNKVKPKEPLQEFGKTASEILADAGILGLSPVLNKHNDTIGYEGQRMGRIDDLVQEIVGGNSVYSLALWGGTLRVLVASWRLPGWYTLAARRIS
jgi:hypothetical protein